MLDVSLHPLFRYLVHGSWILVIGSCFLLPVSSTGSRSGCPERVEHHMSEPEVPVLGSLGTQIERHWREHRPRMVRRLKNSGSLMKALYAAEQLTLVAEVEAIQAGMSPDQARERFREEWAFLPTEEDVPHLPNGDPTVWVAPD